MENAKMLEYLYAAEVRKLALNLQRLAASQAGQTLPQHAAAHPLQEFLLAAHQELQSVASVLKHAPGEGAALPLRR